MFNFSLKILSDFFEEPLNREDIIMALNRRGFEILLQTVNDEDTIFKIDVRNNRSDMLCYLGVAREVASFYGKKLNILSNVIMGSSLPYQFIIDKDVCKDVYVARFDYTDTNKKKIEYVLNVAGQKIGTDVADLENYCSIVYGQVITVIDEKKIKGRKLFFGMSEYMESQHLLSDAAISIKDESNILAFPCFNNISTNEMKGTMVMIGAIYDKIKIRKTERILKKQTAASYVASRGARACDITLAINSMVSMCGTMISHSKEILVNQTNIFISLDRINTLIGNNFDLKYVKDILTTYGFNASIYDDRRGNISVIVPKHRTDITTEVEVIEEFARLIGYDKIIPQIPKLALQYKRNPLYEHIKAAKRCALMMGFNECLGHMLTGSNYNEILRLASTNNYYSNIKLINPVSRKHSLCATTLVLNLLQDAERNYAEGKYDIKLFEVTKVCEKFNSDKEYQEAFHLGMLISGLKFTKSIGINNDIAYQFYDLFELLDALMRSYGVPYEIQPKLIPFFVNGSGGQIIAKNKNIGFLGEISSTVIQKVLSQKIRNPFYYIELTLESFDDSNISIIYPTTKKAHCRDFNFLLKNNQNISELLFFVRSSFSEVDEIKIKDIYSIDKNCKAVLVSIQYSPYLSVDHVELSTKRILEILKKHGFELKS